MRCRRRTCGPGVAAAGSREWRARFGRRRRNVLDLVDLRDLAAALLVTWRADDLLAFRWFERDGDVDAKRNEVVCAPCALLHSLADVLRADHEPHRIGLAWHVALDRAVVVVFVARRNQAFQFDRFALQALPDTIHLMHQDHAALRRMLVT
jgi:hypothetical protein